MATSLVAMGIGYLSGLEMSPENIEAISGLLMAWLVAQGLADQGAGGSTREGKPARARKRKPKKPAAVTEEPAAL